MSSRFSTAHQPKRDFPTAYLPRSQRRGIGSHEENRRRLDAERGSKMLADAIDNYTLTKLVQIRMEELALANKLEREITKPSKLKEGE